jgi:hypothetical protein
VGLRGCIRIIAATPGAPSPPATHFHQPNPLASVDRL